MDLSHLSLYIHIYNVNQYFSMCVFATARYGYTLAIPQSMNQQSGDKI